MDTAIGKTRRRMLWAVGFHVAKLLGKDLSKVLV
jgi:hypothetical protein